MSTNAAGLYVLCSILPTLSTLSVGARIYVRNVKKQKFGVDDWTALAGLVALWGVAGAIIDGTKRDLFGGNSTMDPVTGALIRSWKEGPNVKYTWIIPMITVAALAPIKLSVIFLYRRIFHISRFFHYYSILLCVLSVLWALGFFFASLFQCGVRPWAYWTTVKTIEMYCGDTGGSNVALCFSDVFIDVLILLAPLVMIWEMNFVFWRKVQILAVFALGFLSTAAAGVRVYIMWVDAYNTTHGHINLLHENTKVVMWCLIEISSALIACCLPVLRPLFSDTGVARLMSKLQYRMFPSSPSSGPSDRELEEGMAFRSIGGTDFKVVLKRESRSRKDSKMSTHVESSEIDRSRDVDGSTQEVDATFKEMGLSKEMEGKPS